MQKRQQETTGLQTSTRRKTDRTDSFISMTILVQRSLLRVCITLALYIKISHHICLFQGIKMNYQNMNFLHKMGGYFSQQCLNETTDFRFPGRLRRSHKRIQQWSSMSSSNRLFSYWAKNLPKGVWNTSNIEKFQNRIHQQIEELQICLLEELPKQGTAFRCRC